VTSAPTNDTASDDGATGPRPLPGGRVSSIDLILLGLLMEGPQNAYELNKVVVQRQIRSWVKISEASVYRNLRALADKGMLERHTTRDGLNPEKTVFSLSPGGRDHFTRLIVDAAQKDIALHFDFDVWLAHLGYLPADQAGACTAALRTNLDAARVDIDGMLRNHRTQLPREVAALMDLRGRVLDVIDTWLDEFETPPVEVVPDG
jgi:DNA-binding PadR family transcriptional regulator